MVIRLTGNPMAGFDVLGGGRCLSRWAEPQTASDGLLNHLHPFAWLINKDGIAFDDGRATIA